MKAIGRLKVLLGILQQSHYDAALFRAWLARHPRPADWDAFREKVAVDWTRKARVLFWTSVVISPLLPGALRASMLLLAPFEWLAARWICMAAAGRLRRHRFRAVIGITGSFGKTTTKEIAAQILGQKFRVHKTPENVNTLLGVAQWIRRTQFQDGDVVIVEMGAYRRGDIAAMCRLVLPTVGILTGLNEAHRERFGSLEATQAAKSELIDALPGGGIGLWNSDAKNLTHAVGERKKKWEERGIRLIPYSREGSGDWKISWQTEDEIKMRVEITQERGSVIGETMGLMGSHHCAPLGAALFLAGELGLLREEIRSGIKKLHPLERRLHPLYVPGNRLLIDDSYNATLDGAASALEALRGIKRRKIGVFAGIQEQGNESERINRELGRRIAKEFDIILLGRTQVTDAVAQGLAETGFDKDRLIRYDSAKEVEEVLKRITQDGDCIYFSPYDRPAIYL